MPFQKVQKKAPARQKSLHVQISNSPKEVGDHFKFCLIKFENPKYLHIDIPPLIQLSLSS